MQKDSIVMGRLKSLLRKLHPQQTSNISRNNNYWLKCCIFRSYKNMTQKLTTVIVIVGISIKY